ncbi:MAG: 6-phosphogluconolactonase [Beggiatoa sp. IS2]|nr:MAG: 6-phosphogluconolactonase [Beggiatoa sp. IS2]
MIWHILESATAVAREACHLIIATAHQAIAERGCFRMVLAGGSTPCQTYQLLQQTQTDWQHWFIYYGDERCLPVNDRERNSVMATEAWLGHVAVKSEQIYPIPAELGAIEASKRYAQIISTAMPFDLVLLGMGEDGHTASLFPDHSHTTTELVHPVFNAPKPPPERVSLSVQALSQTRKLLFLVTGKSKQAPVLAWRKGENLPVSQIICPHGEVLLDQDSGGLL